MKMPTGIAAEHKEGSFPQIAGVFGVSRSASVNLLCGYTGLAGALSFWVLIGRLA